MIYVCCKCLYIYIFIFLFIYEGNTLMSTVSKFNEPIITVACMYLKGRQQQEVGYQQHVFYLSS